MQDPFVRISKLVGMLTAGTDGEVLNAVRAINKILNNEKIHIGDVTKRIANGAPQAEQPKTKSSRPPWEDGEARSDGRRTREEPRRRPSRWSIDKADIDKAMPKKAQLDDWSFEFLESIEDQVVHQGRTLTEKQRDKLNEIMDKLGL